MALRLGDVLMIYFANIVTNFVKAGFLVVTVGIMSSFRSLTHRKFLPNRDVYKNWELPSPIKKKSMATGISFRG